MIKASYQYLVDWNGNGAFNHPYSDISPYVLTASWYYGRPQGDTAFDNAGRVTIVLDNSSGIFSPFNASSPIYGLIRPDIKVKLIMTVGVTQKTKFCVDLEDIVPVVGATVEVSTATLTGKGVIERLSKAGGEVARQESIKEGAAIDAILTADGIPAGSKSIAVGLTTLANWWLRSTTTKLQAIRELQAAGFGRFREGMDGRYVYDDRDYVFTPPNNTPKATYGGPGGLRMYQLRQLTQYQGLYDVARGNVRTFNISDDTVLAVIADVHNKQGTSAPPIVPPKAGAVNGTLNIWVNCPSQFVGVHSWGTVDLEANRQADAQGDDITVYVSATLVPYGDRAELRFVNTSPYPAHLVTLRVHGVGIIEGDPIPLKAGTGTREYPNASQWFTDLESAQQELDYAIALYGHKRPALSFVVKGNYDLAHLTEVQARDLADRIHVTAGAEYGLYIDDDFIVDRISHAVDEGRVHSMTVECTVAPTEQLGPTGKPYSPIVPNAVLPSMPTNVALSVSGVNFFLDWGPPAMGAYTLEDACVQFAQDAAFTTGVITRVGLGKTYSFGLTAPGKTYYARVAWKNSALVASHARALNPDPNCTDETAWATYSGSNWELATVTDGKIGNSVIRSTGAPGLAGVQIAQPVPISPTKSYLLHGAVRRKSGDRRVAFFARFLDSDGLAIDPTGLITGWYSVMSAAAGARAHWTYSLTLEQLPVGSEWQDYYFTCGYGGTGQLPENVKSIQIGAFLNYSGGGTTTDGVVEIQDFWIKEAPDTAAVVTAAGGAGTYGWGPFCPVVGPQTSSGISSDTLTDELLSLIAAGGEGVTIYYQEDEPPVKDVGDIWYETDQVPVTIYRWNGTAWADITSDVLSAALTAASSAQATADGKIVTFAQTSQPTATAIGDLWIDTDNHNKLYRWDGTEWEPYQDTHNDAAIATHATAISNLATAVNAKITIFYQASQPVATATGDIWYDTDASPVVIYRWNGSAWVDITTDTLSAALTAASSAQATADGKINTYAQAGEPTAEAVGDLWIDTDDNNKLYRWNGTQWLPYQDTHNDAAIASHASQITNLTTAVASKITIFYQTSQPTANVIGDVWYDTDANPVVIYRWNGSTWVDITTNALSAALAAAGDAQATADGKIVTFAQAASPTATAAGDLWVDTDDNNKLYRWSGSAWVSVQDTHNDATIASHTSSISSLTTAVNAKITIFYQTSQPTANVTGDIWYDTDASPVVIYRWNGSSWIDITTNALSAALDAAGDAQATADGKINTYAQASQPTAEAAGDLWIETDNNNKLYRWSGSAWVAYQDTHLDSTVSSHTTQISNLTTAVNAKITIFYQGTQPTANVTGDIWYETDVSPVVIRRWNGSSWIDITTNALSAALEAAGDAQATADGKINTYAQAGEPTAEAVGDLWVDTDDGNKLYRWSGSVWVSIQDALLATHSTQISNLTTAVASKITIFYQTSQPTANVTGDIWYDTDATPVTIKRWNGSTWVDITTTALSAALDAAADAQAIADGKILTFAQDSQPTATAPGDLWIETDNNNCLHRWSGSQWVNVRDGTIAQAQAAADGKRAVFYQVSQPPTTGRQTGDLWFDTDDDYKLYAWNGTAWVLAHDWKRVIAGLNEDGTVVAGKVIASSVLAGELTVSKFRVMPESLIADPYFEDISFWTLPTDWSLQNWTNPGSAADWLGVRRCAVLYVASTPRWLQSNWVPYSGVGQVLELSFRAVNYSDNQYVRVYLRAFLNDGSGQWICYRDVPANTDTAKTWKVQGLVPANAKAIRVMAHNQGGTAFTDWFAMSEIKVIHAMSADRGDPAQADFTSFSNLSGWHDLDLSSVVPVGMRLIMLRFRALAPQNHTCSFHVRKKGATNELNVDGLTGPDPGLYAPIYDATFMVHCDDNRTIQYRTSRVVGDGDWQWVQLTVAAYWP